MKNKQSKICFIILLILALLNSNQLFSQENKNVKVEFEIDGKKVNFSNDIILTISINGKEIKPLMFVNGFVVPDFGGVTEVDVSFTYKKKLYVFTNLSVTKFNADWIFGIKKKVAKNIKKEYYLKFSSTVVTVTEYK